MPKAKPFRMSEAKARRIAATCARADRAFLEVQKKAAKANAALESLNVALLKVRDAMRKALPPAPTTIPNTEPEQ